MDSRTVKAVLKELCASPRPIAEVNFEPKTGDITRIVFESASWQGVQSGPVPSTSPGSIPGSGSIERDKAPPTAKPRRLTAVDSLRKLPPEWQEDRAPING